jgi:hypothetical protein
MTRKRPDISRDDLYHRHRLSHQQVGEWTGEPERERILEEKISQLTMLSELLFIASAFRREGIWFVPIKGPLLSCRIYGDATFRRCSDLDFLVRSEDVNQAIILLLRSGYKSLGFEWPLPTRHQKAVLHELNQFALFHPTAEIKVEIHWKLFPLPVAGFQTCEALVRANLTEIQYAGHSFLQLTPEFELLYLVIHGGLHAWSRLKWLQDIRDFLNRITLNTEKFEDFSGLMNAGRMIGLCNALLRHFYPGDKLLPFNHHFPLRLLRYALDRISLPPDVAGRSKRDFFAFLRFRMKAFPGLLYKYRVLSSVTFSTDKLDRYRIPFYPSFRMAGLLAGFLFRCLTGKTGNAADRKKLGGLAANME